MRKARGGLCLAILARSSDAQASRVLSHGSLRGMASGPEELGWRGRLTLKRFAFKCSCGPSSLTRSAPSLAIASLTLPAHFLSFRNQFPLPLAASTTKSEYVWAVLPRPLAEKDERAYCLGKAAPSSLFSAKYKKGMNLHPLFYMVECNRGFSWFR